MIGAIKLEKESMEKQYPECLKLKNILLLSNVEKQKKEIDDFLKTIKNGLKTTKKNKQRRNNTFRSIFKVTTINMSNMLTILNLELKLIVIILKVKQLMQLQDGPSKV